MSTSAPALQRQVRRITSHKAFNSFEREFENSGTAQMSNEHMYKTALAHL